MYFADRTTIFRLLWQFVGPAVADLFDERHLGSKIKSSFPELNSIAMIAISDNVQIRKDKPSGTITLNRPDRRNALSREIVEMLIAAFDDFHQEKSVRAVILTGSGDNFCSGTDLYQLKETAESKNSLETWHQDVTQLQRLIEKMLRFPKPIIAAVNGWTIGTGLALMLASDIVVAGEKSKLQTPEPLRGLSAGITTPLLSFRIGSGLAARVLFAGQPILANEALNLGLFHETVEDDLIWARSHELAKACADGARESHQITKQMLNETIGENLFTQLSIGAATMAAARTTEAALEGINAFLEKREPNWG
jgi:methylglutaconyl-CoA hydratase